MPRKKVNFVKTKKVKKGDFKGLQKGVKSKKMSEKRALKKQEKGQGFISKKYGSNPVEMSPYKMGHESPAKMESAKQERKDLMKDMPVDKRASAMQMGHESPAKMGHESPAKMKGSWMSKHSKSAFHMGHESPAEMHCTGKRK